MCDIGIQMLVTNNRHDHETQGIDLSGFCSIRENMDFEKHCIRSSSLSRRRGEPQTDWSAFANRDFFADSPYLKSFMEKEMLNFEAISKTLDDISSEFAIFSQAAGLFTKAIRRLSSACKLQPESNDKASEENVERKRKALGPDITDTLEHMAMLLEKIADAQEEFQASLQSSTVNLKHDVLGEIQMACMLKIEAESRTKDSEELFSEYLHGKQWRENKHTYSSATFGSSVSNSFTWQEKFSDSSKSKMTGDPLVNESTNARNPLSIHFWSSKSCEKLTNLDDGCVKCLDGETKTGSSARHCFLQVSDDNDNSYGDSNLQTQSSSLVEINLPFQVEPGEEGIQKKLTQSGELKKHLRSILIEQTIAELKRFQFFKTLVHGKYERILNVSKYISKFGHSIQLYTDTCSKIVSKEMLTLTRKEELNEKLHLNYQLNERPMWDMRESLIMKSLDSLTDATNEVQEELNDINILHDSDSVDAYKSTKRKTEEEVKFWDLPSELVSHSRYLREPPPGVLVEGWLYRLEETGSMLSKQLSWRRQWYILRNSGLFCLQQNDDIIGQNYTKDKNSNLNCEEEGDSGDLITKVKICDVVLCTIKPIGEVPSNKPSHLSVWPRFCFELVVANQEPIILQARGPKELQRWVKGVQSAVEDILTRGNLNSPQLNKNIGEKKCSIELQRTVMQRGLSMFDTKSNEYEENKVAGSYSKLGFMANDNSLVLDDTSEIDKSHPYKSKIIKKLMNENCTCADCGKEYPDWVSLNLGVLVCLECSGVHRSLGVHVSQVRSLSLDSLSNIEVYVLLALGNARMNKIYERLIPSKKRKSKPDSLSSREVREEWIKCKYVKKTFVGLAKVENTSELKRRNEKISRLLRKAAKKADVVSVAKFLAHGAIVDWDNEGKHRSALQICADLMKHGNNDQALLCAKILVQNGATTDGLDDRSRNLLELRNY